MNNGQSQEIDLGPVDELLDRYSSDLEATIPLLQGIQSNYGYLPLEALEYVSKKTGIPSSHLFGVATFYTQFRLKPMGKNMLRVCMGTACHVQGADRILDVCREELKVPAGEDTTEDALFTVDPVACLGCCSLAPVVMMNETTHGRLDGPKTRKLMKKLNREAKKAEAEAEAQA